jgi:hypothetical protein
MRRRRSGLAQLYILRLSILVSALFPSNADTISGNLAWSVSRPMVICGSSRRSYIAATSAPCCLLRSSVQIIVRPPQLRVQVTRDKVARGHHARQLGPGPHHLVATAAQVQAEFSQPGGACTVGQRPAFRRAQMSHPSWMERSFSANLARSGARSSAPSRGRATDKRSKEARPPSGDQASDLHLLGSGGGI